MTEEVEDRSLEEPLDLEETEDELCRCGKSKIKYTRALLLEFTEVEVCRKLPRDFDLLILRELDGAYDGTTEHKMISVNSSICGPLPSSRGERCDRHLLIASKKSYSQGNCHSEITDVVRQRLLQESGYNAAGILGQKIQKSDLFQLRKSGNPYRPPHKKTPQPLDASSGLGKGSSKSSSVSETENVQTDSVDRHGVPVADIDDLEISPVGKSEASCKSNEGSGTIEDNQLTFDDFWAEILEILHPEQEPKLTPIPFHDDTSDSEAEIRLPNEDSLKRANHSKMSEILELLTLDNSGDATDSDAEISLPDEASLITIEDLVAPHILSTLNEDSARKNLGSLNVVTQGKLHSQLSYPQTSPYMFSAERPFLYRGKENKNLLNKFVKPNIIHSTPTPNCYTCSYFHHQPFPETTLTKTNINDSLVQCSVLDQPNMSSPQQNRLLIDAKCPNPIKPSEQTICQGFGKSYAVALDPTVKGGFNDQKASGKLYTDAVLGRVRQPGRSTLPSQRPI